MKITDLPELSAADLTENDVVVVDHDTGNGIETQKITWQNLLNKIYPVGSLYMSAKATSPASLFGGTWEQIKDRFILAAGDTYAAGSTGGSPTHTHDVSGNAGIGVEQNTTAYDATGAKISEEFPIALFAHTHEYDSVFESSNAFYSIMRCIKTKGSANEQSNMPPYITVYVWRRIA